MKVIWTGDHPQTQVLQDAKGGLRFQYVPRYHTPECLCSFSLFSEVGQLYRKWFDGFFVDHRISDEPVTYDEPPYFADGLEEPITMKEFQPDEWPHLNEAAKSIQAFADEHWPDLGVQVSLSMKADTFTLAVAVAKRQTHAEFKGPVAELQARDIRQWITARITQAVALSATND